MKSEFSSATKNKLKAAISNNQYGSHNSNHCSSLAMNNEISALRTPIYNDPP